MSTSVKITAPKADLPLIDNRFSIRRKMSSTALADVYWADDLYMPTQGEQDHIVLLILAAPAISTLPSFAKAWSAIMSRPAPPAASYPNILAWGNEGDNYWFSCSNTQGSLLSEYFNEIDKRGLAPEQAFKLTEAISHALSNVQAGAFGYFEPGSTVRTEQGYVLLNAPLVKVMHSLLLQQTGVRPTLALHSPWLSPSVAVGDLPVTEDDSFSMASLYQMLLGLQPPYGEQSTLTALARGTPVTANPKLKAEAQQILNQALSLQRNQRPENPEALLKALGRKNYRKAWLPLGALAALGVVVYASYHLVSEFDSLLNKPAPIAQIQTPEPAAPASSTETIVGNTDTASRPTEEVSLVNEPAAKPAEAATTEAPTTAAALNPDTLATSPITGLAVEPSVSPTLPSTTSTAPHVNELPTSANTQTTSTEVNTETSPEQQAQLTALILKATEAFNAGKTDGTEGALASLRQVWAVQRQDPNARALLNKIIAQQQQQTENHLNLNRPEEARTSLSQTDDLIREFTLTDRIEEQVRLESILEIREREQREAGDLLQQAKTAIKRGNLSKEDGENNALAYLNKLMFILPNNAEGQTLLEDVVQARQAQIKRHLERNKLSKAGDYLDETRRLIRKYNLTDLTQTQASLERDYQKAVETRQTSNTPSQTPEAETNLVVTGSTVTEPVEQPVILIPPPAEGERYVTPNDDLSSLNQATPSTNQQTVEQSTPIAIQNPEPAASVQTVNRPARPRPAPAQAPSEEIQGGPAQLEIIEQPLPAAITQPTVVEPEPKPAPTVTTQPEELPVEVVLPEPQAIPVPAGTINNQGVLNVRGLVAPVEEDIPDSERK